ncbi:MAG: cohesin domain-containing protein [Patescibacteria group bacterium]
MNKKVIIALVTLLLLLVGLGVGVFLVRQTQEVRKKAAPASSIEILPKSPTASAGQEFTLSVNMKTSTNEISGAELHITFDADKLTLRDFLPTTSLPTVFVSPKIDNTAGTASMTLGAQPSNLFSGEGMIATLKFQAKSLSGSARVDFAPQTLATALSETQDVLVSKTGAQVTVLASSTGILENPLTPTPSVSQQAQGGAESSTTPTPTAKLTPTPTKVATGSATSSASIPVAGVSLPIYFSLAAGIVIMLMGIVLAL